MGKSTRFAIEYPIMAKSKKNVESDEQTKMFIDAARALGCDKDEVHFAKPKEPQPRKNRNRK